MISCDVLVLGVGGVGSAALAQLASRGIRAIGIDRFAPPHDRGSSHGHTRAIRQAYFEHPNYVPLLRRAYELWDELEQSVEKHLFHRVGLLEAGIPDGEVVPGVLASAAEHNLAVQRYSVEEARRRWPMLNFDDSFDVVFEENAGYLLVEQCIEASCDIARRHGAEIHTDEVVSWRPSGEGVEVETTQSRYTASRLIVTAGAWASDLLATAGLQTPLRVLRKHLHWHRTADPRYRSTAGHDSFPVFFFEEPADCDGVVRFFYGFPQCDERGVKVAEHTGGSETPDPLTDPRDTEADDIARVSAFVDKRLSGVTATPHDHRVCFYTMSPDGHFVIDRLPTAPAVCFAAGLSGHGFKFAPALAEALCRLALDEPISLPLDFLRMR
ncbi:MAG: N-methyl-L-tryptophan oxidase [Planctomycetales bacterium]|nr:N-methyl-L-tryptophan oxidase [Planctomycetales bacterium]